MVDILTSWVETRRLVESQVHTPERPVLRCEYNLSQKPQEQGPDEEAERRRDCDSRDGSS